MSVPREVGDRSKRFVVGDRLGEGGMGVVYAGAGPHGEQAAIKFLHPHMADVPEVVARFLREADAVGRISSPFVAPVLLAGRTRGLYWIAYERLFGETLEERLRRVRLLPRPVVRTFVEHILTGLEAAHEVTVVHRDVKPANVYLQRLEASERAVLLDFGISKYTSDAGDVAQQPLTSTTQMLGTASYMAPEQVEGAKGVDARADLYAAGVVAFEACTGHLPFLQRSAWAALDIKLHGVASSLEVVSGVRWPAACESFFSRALARDRDRRFSTASSMRAAWLEATSGQEWPDVSRLREALAQPPSSDRVAAPTCAERG